MKLDIIVFVFVLGSLSLGLNSPYVAAVLYVFFDFLPYQLISPGFYKDIPTSKILAIMSFAFYFFFDRKSAGRFTLLHLLMILFTIWIELTTFWAVNPDAAWRKWDWAFKSVLYACFLPLLLRTRARIEGIILAFLFGVGASVLTAGIKTANGGGGYGSLRRLIPFDFNLGETSTLAIVAVMTLPYIVFIVRHSVLMPNWKVVKLGFYGLAAIVPLCVVGTYARAGLVAFAAWAGIAYIGAKRKVLVAIAAVIVGIIAEPYLPQEWRGRMETIEDYQNESSASTRLAVWKWTIEFAASHPWGGGFNSFIGNQIATVNSLGEVTTQQSNRAFHSSYFEVLGEQGYPGLVLYFGMIFTSFAMLARMYFGCRNLPEHRWIRDLSYAIAVALFTYLAGSAFVGIAYQASSLMSYSIVISLWQIYRRDVVGPKKVVPPYVRREPRAYQEQPEPEVPAAAPGFRPAARAGLADAKPSWRRG